MIPALTAATILLFFGLIGVMSYVITLKRRINLLDAELQTPRQIAPVEDASKALALRFNELNKGFLEAEEKKERELNNIWAEFEEMRTDLLKRIDGAFTPEKWRATLEKKIPSFALIRDQIAVIIAADRELGDRLQEQLPGYLLNDDPIAGIFDFARLPFERINWFEILILPVSAVLERAQNPNTSLEEPFNKLLTLLGYQSIIATPGESYRPELHEVIEQRLSGGPRGAVIATRHRGYAQQNSILRKAKVIISAGQS